MERRKNRKVGPLRYQRLEQSMIGYCDNYTANTQKPSLSRHLHADRTSNQYLDQHICFSVVRMPLSRWPAVVGWYQIITVKQ